MSTEIKVGIVFFIGMLILLVMTVVVTGFSFFESGYTFPVYFKNVAGLEEGSRVLFSGVNIGNVDRITVAKGEVSVLIRVKDKDVVIPADSKFAIEQSNLLAGMQVSIMPGTSQKSVREEEHKEGLEPAAFTQALADAATSAKKAIDDIREPLVSTVENIEDVTKAVRKGPGTAHELIYGEDIGENIRVATEKLGNILADLDNAKGTAGKILKDDALYEKLNSTLTEAEKTLSGLREIVDTARKGEGTVGKLLKDEEVYDNIRDATRDVKDVTAKVKQGLEGSGLLAKLFSDESGELYSDIKDTAAGAKEFFRMLNTGQGTLGKLFSSDEVYDDIKSITGDIRDAAAQLNKKDNTIGKLLHESTLYDKAEGALDDVSETLGGVARMKIFVHLDAFTTNHPFQQYRYHVSLRVWPNDHRYFLIGGTFTDVGEASPLLITESDYETGAKLKAGADFQMAQVLYLGPSPKKDPEESGESGKKWRKDGDQYALTLRGGLIDSQVGGGIDFDFWRYFRITADIRDRHRDTGRYFEDIDPFYARAYISVRLFKYFRVYAGADNLADQAVMSFGICVEWEDKDIRNIVGIAGSAF
jgi:phospholipid/cholesterol/gamma-HCH transport system substrate-binding protein